MSSYCDFGASCFAPALPSRLTLPAEQWRCAKRVSLSSNLDCWNLDSRLDMDIFRWDLCFVFSDREGRHQTTNHCTSPEVLSNSFAAVSFLLIKELVLFSHESPFIWCFLTSFGRLSEVNNIFFWPGFCCPDGAGFEGQSLRGFAFQKERSSAIFFPLLSPLGRGKMAELRKETSFLHRRAVFYKWNGLFSACLALEISQEIAELEERAAQEDADAQFRQAVKVSFIAQGFMWKGLLAWFMLTPKAVLTLAALLRQWKPWHLSTEARTSLPTRTCSSPVWGIFGDSLRRSAQSLRVLDLSRQALLRRISHVRVKLKRSIWGYVV